MVLLGEAQGHLTIPSLRLPHGHAEWVEAILAGDVRFELRNREASAEERAYIDSLGDVAVSDGLRTVTPPLASSRSIWMPPASE